MKYQPLVSIMMPVYNGYPLIRASVQSLINQNYERWECIIIDDGSTDETPAFLESIIDSRFIIHRLERNSGRAIARQKALDLCHGEYIGMLDAEDLIHPDKIRVQVECLEANKDVSLVTCGICSFGTKTDLLLVRGTTIQGAVIFNGDNHPIHAPSLYRAEIAKKCRYNPYLRLGEDQDYLEKYLEFNPKYFILPQILYYYSELDSVTKDKIVKNYYLYVIKYFKQRNYKKAIVFLLKFLYGLTFLRFISIDRILYKRGRMATDLERKDFNTFCKPFVNQALNSSSN